MESATVRLIVTQGPNLGHEYIVHGDKATFGRSASNSIVLPAPEISRRHARLWLEGETMFLEDLGSTNGTFVNNKRLDNPIAVYDGDEIQIGDSFRLLLASPDGITRPVSMVGEVEGGQPQPAAASGDAADIADHYAASEIPTPRPPLYANLDEQAFVDEQLPSESQQRRTILWIGCGALILVSLCLLTVLFLDSYQQGRLLYCGSLNPFFRFLLGPFGFSPICP